jgi:hypothetical protein
MNKNMDQKTKITDNTDEMTVNGGKCWMRKGYWSQTVTDSTVYIPISYLISFLNVRSNNDIGDTAKYRDDNDNIDGLNPNPNPNPNYNSSFNKWNISFKHRTITISLKDGSSECVDEREYLALDLEHNIISNECSWTMDNGLNDNDNSNDINTSSNNDNDNDNDNDNSKSSVSSSSKPLQYQYLALHLIKAPPVEWFQGSEWWDRVCIDDEPIDTITCSIGSNVGQLPVEARERAERENRRFHDLTLDQRESELNSLTLAKMVRIKRLCLLSFFYCLL